MDKVLLSSKNMNWCTPDDLFQELDNEFHFKLDAAANSWNAKCNRFFTPAMDALKQCWDVGGGQSSATLHMDERLGNGCGKRIRNHSEWTTLSSC